jgi:hypothetical protein
MAAPNSRGTLADYCKRRLGEPVIEVNIDEDQVEDRIDESLQYYREFHSDATVRTYLKHLVTATDVTNQYIPLANNIIFVSKMFPVAGGITGGGGMFDVKYQLMLNNIHDLMNFGGDLAYYEQMQQYLSTLDMKLNGTPQVQFSRRQNRLYVFGDFVDGDIKAGDYIVAEVYTEVSDSDHTSIFNDMFVKEYTTALIKQQWGQNLIKFEGMQLPGGVILNGRQIYDDATGEIATLRENIRLEHEFPPDFFVG